MATAWSEDLASQKNPNKRNVQQTGYYTNGYTNLGYYQDSDQTLNLPRRDGSTNLVAGDIIYKDMNGDGFIMTTINGVLVRIISRVAIMVCMQICLIRGSLQIFCSKEQHLVICIWMM